MIGKFTHTRKIKKRSTWQETEITTYNTYLLQESPEKQGDIPQYNSVLLASIYLQVKTMNSIKS